jgi:hypothetical protein
MEKSLEEEILRSIKENTNLWGSVKTVRLE